VVETIAELESGTHRALLAAQASLRLGHNLGSGPAPGNLRFGHLQVRLKQQLLRSRDGNGNCSCRDSDVELPEVRSVTEVKSLAFLQTHACTDDELLEKAGEV
jgi:hypothetical protein